MSGGKAPAPKPAPKEQQPAPKEQKVASKSLLAPMQPYLSVISSDIKCFLHVDERARKERETYSDTTGERLRKTLSKLR